MSNYNFNNGCDQPARYTPANIYNPAGLSNISYRVGTFNQFKSDMLTSIISQKKLKDLTTREDSDLSIGLLDSWAMVADILSFYQERIANEGFLRTAIERRSILELARSIAYELRPGVAARGYLAFTMESVSAFPKKGGYTTVKVGTKVQSIPMQNEKPQIFETIEEIKVSNTWNEIHPKQVKNQDLGESLKNGLVILDGTSTKLKNGDGLLFIIHKTPVAFVLIKEILVNVEKKQTFVYFDKVDDSKISTSSKLSSSESGTFLIDFETSFGKQDLEYLVKRQWTESALQSEIHLKNWSADVIVDTVNSFAKDQDKEMTEDGVYAFRIKCGVFGNTAIRYESLPLVLRNGGKVDGVEQAPVYPISWDNPEVSINTDTNVGPKETKFKTYQEVDINLDNIYNNAQSDSWLVLRDSNKSFAYKVSGTSERSVLGFSLTARVTGVKLERRSFIHEEKIIALNLDQFGFRQTTVYTSSEKLVLADLPINEPIEGNDVLLEKMVGNLTVGRPVVITGELFDQNGVIRKEISFIKEIVHFDPGIHLLTRIYIEKLAYKYNRQTVSINANIASITHGESKLEALGSGNPAQQFQKFALRQKPLTYISASTPSGIESTLQIFVEGVKWQEINSFSEELDPIDDVFITRRNNGETFVLFGNGINGRLPPSGRENIMAKYRVGIGSEGNLAADQLSILMTRPFGVRGVTNPLKVAGGTDAENLNNARTNAPRTVLILDRIVSLEDFKNFAQGFAGIGKATSYVVNVNNTDTVLVSVSSTIGEEIDMDLHTHLESAINSYKDPITPFTLRSFISKKFDVSAKIKISSGREFEAVKGNVKNALNSAFSFYNREFGQGVTKSEVIHIIQGVDGIGGVKLESLYEHSMPEGLLDFIPAEGEPDPNIQDGIIIPSLLLVNGEGITLMEMEI